MNTRRRTVAALAAGVAIGIAGFGTAVATAQAPEGNTSGGALSTQEQSDLVAMREGSVVANGPMAQTLANLDAPIALGDDLGVVLDGAVVERDSDWHLLRVEADDVSLWLPDHGAAIGQRVRLRVLARDVSLAAERAAHSSILNLLAGEVDAIADDPHPGQLLVRVRTGSTALLARITRRSAAALALRGGQRVWLQVKSAAVLD